MSRAQAYDTVARHAALKYRTASATLDKARQRALPVGREVTWEHGDHLRWGRVVEYFAGRVKVFRESTGRDYWVDCWRIREISP